jgi:hypothetical protein
MLANTRMPEMLKIAPPSKFKRWLKYLTLNFVSLLHLLASMIFFWKVKFVPPISATVVDAITGKPLPGMSVCLQARVWDFGNVSVLREDQTHTDSNGRFAFKASTHVLDLLQSWERYTIEVEDPKIRYMFPQPCGGPNPWVDERQVPPKDNTPFYFPVLIIEQVSWHLVVDDPTYRKMIFPLGAHIPLIPVLQSPEQCQSMQVPSLVGFCRKLNNSWAGDTYRLLRAKPESDNPAN